MVSVRSPVGWATVATVRGEPVRQAHGCLVPTGSYLDVADVLVLLEATGYERLPYRQHEKRNPERPVGLVRGGPLLVSSARREQGLTHLYVRTAGFFEPGVYEATMEALAARGFKDPEDKAGLETTRRGRGGGGGGPRGARGGGWGGWGGRSRGGGGPRPGVDITNNAAVRDLMDGP
jgi:uncharacterized membrane protein YgcG